MSEQGMGMSRWLAVTATAGWLLANGLDVLAALFAVQYGSTFSFARHHPAEYFLIYAGMRLLGTLAVWLLAASAGKRWKSVSTTVWSALTACALVTAVAAWWRLYQ
jgi:uncharacterized membrane-anchored protein